LPTSYKIASQQSSYIKKAGDSKPESPAFFNRSGFFKSRTLKSLITLNIAEQQKGISVHLRVPHQRHQRSRV
jgi:hypothetical protein